MGYSPWRHKNFRHTLASKTTTTLPLDYKFEGRSLATCLILDFQHRASTSREYEFTLLYYNESTKCIGMSGV